MEVLWIRNSGFFSRIHLGGGLCSLSAFVNYHYCQLYQITFSAAASRVQQTVTGHYEMSVLIFNSNSTNTYVLLKWLTVNNYFYTIYSLLRYHNYSALSTVYCTWHAAMPRTEKLIHMSELHQTEWKLLFPRIEQRYDTKTEQIHVFTAQHSSIMCN